MRSAGTGLPLAWRIFAVNAAVFAIGTAALALSPATVSFPIIFTEALVLGGGLVVILLLNLVLVRRSLAPLRRLMTVMRQVDLLRPGSRVRASGPAEVRDLGAVFNEMLDRLEAERRESGRQALANQEDERKRVAQELHDEIGQAMTGVMLMLSRLVDRAPVELRDEVLEAREAARASLDDVRRIARRLRPEALDDLGLVPALNALSESFAELTGLRVNRRFTPLLPALGADAELTIFRVAQESLTNAARHSGAGHVELRIEHVDGGASLRVRDRGRGLTGARFGSGIRGMEERALLVGGKLEVFSPRDGGVEVHLFVPADAP